MLVLTRFTSERVILRTPHGEVITMTLIEAGHGRARLGFDAPIDVSVHREEIDVQREREKDSPPLPVGLNEYGMPIETHGGPRPPMSGGNGGAIAGREGR